MASPAIAGAGIGLRRGLFGDLRRADPGAFDFMEIAPENWIGVGGRFKRGFQWFAERYPMVCHGLSLSLGGPEPLDRDLLLRIGEALAGRARPRALVVLVVVAPRDLGERVDGPGHGREGGVVEPFAEPAIELGASQLHVGHALHDSWGGNTTFRPGHADPPLVPGSAERVPGAA